MKRWEVMRNAPHRVCKAFCSVFPHMWRVVFGGIRISVTVVSHFIPLNYLSHYPPHTHSKSPVFRPPLEGAFTSGCSLFFPGEERTSASSPAPCPLGTGWQMEGSQVTKIIPLCSEAGVSHNPRVHGDQRPARRGRLMFSGRVVQSLCREQNATWTLVHRY